jgi:hypothetical protein
MWIPTAAAAIALASAAAAAGAPGAPDPEPRPPAPRIIARWSFDEMQGDAAGDGVDGLTRGKVINALRAEGRSAPGALAFEDYSLKNYLKPDVREATRVVVPHQDRLNPQGPFTVRAVVFPTRDPIYYGGILEKGRGLRASYRLLLLRGLKVRAAFGDPQTTVTSAKPLALNAWHEVEMRFDGSSLILVVDGVEAGRAAAKGPPASRDDAVIGERFSGRVDEVALSAP